MKPQRDTKLLTAYLLIWTTSREYMPLDGLYCLCFTYPESITYLKFIKFKTVRRQVYVLDVRRKWQKNTPNHSTGEFKWQGLLFDLCQCLHLIEAKANHVNVSMNFITYSLNRLRISYLVKIEISRLQNEKKNVL